MAVTNSVLSTNAAGDAGAGDWVAIGNGPVVVELVNSSDLTLVNINIEYSPDGGTTVVAVAVNVTAALANGKALFVGNLPAGSIRENITGGGAGDNINISAYHEIVPTQVTLAAVETKVDAILVDTGTTLDGKINTLNTESTEQKNLIRMIQNTCSTLLSNLVKLR